MELKGYLDSEDSFYFGHVIKWLYFRCPGSHEENPKLQRHETCVPVTRKETFDTMGRPVWHYEIKDEKIYLTPSIDASQSECKFHDSFTFTPVPKREDI